MATVTGVVDTLEKKAGKGPYVLKVGGHYYRIFTKPTVSVGDFVEIDYNAQQREGYPDDLIIVSCKETEAAPTPSTGSGKAEVPAEVWSAKDRAIMMQSALNASAQYMRAVAAVNPEGVTLANWLEASRQAYKRIRAAHADEPIGADARMLEEAKASARAALEHDEDLPF